LAVLTGSTIGGGNTKTFQLDAGDYTVQEGTQANWILTGIGGGDPIDADTFKCTVDGTGGSTGSGKLSTRTVSVSLKNGDTVTCVFENTAILTTRTRNKVVVNDNDGTALESAWTLTATGNPGTRPRAASTRSTT
jgi:hypothetical protein